MNDDRLIPSKVVGMFQPNMRNFPSISHHFRKKMHSISISGPRISDHVPTIPITLWQSNWTIPHFVRRFYHSNDDKKTQFIVDFIGFPSHVWRPQAIKPMNSHLRLPFLPTFSPSRAICSMRWRVEPCQARFQLRCKGTCWPSDLDLTLGIKNDETIGDLANQSYLSWLNQLKWGLGLWWYIYLQNLTTYRVL